MTFFIAMSPDVIVVMVRIIIVRKVHLRRDIIDSPYGTSCGSDVFYVVKLFSLVKDLFKVVTFICIVEGLFYYSVLIMDQCAFYSF